MHIVLVYRYYNDGIVYYNLTFCTRKSLMTDLGLNEKDHVGIPAWSFRFYKSVCFLIDTDNFQCS